MASPPFKHQARKRFGQNFLVDHGIIHHIVRSIGPQSTDNIVEIGPGQGAITGSLLSHCPKLNVIELDRDLIPMLRVQFEKYPEFKVHESDALKFDFSQLKSEQDAPLRIVGNLPYNISTPLIFHLLEYRSLVQDMHFMLQKEVVMRLAAKPRDKNYGRLSVIAQYYCDVENLFEVPPESFQPRPKVMSAIVRMSPHKSLPAIADDATFFSEVVKQSFQQRRKTLRNSLKPILELVPNIEDYPLDFGQRAEQLSVTDFVHLSNFIFQNTPS